MRALQARIHRLSCGPFRAWVKNDGGAGGQKPARKRRDRGRKRHAGREQWPAATPGELPPEESDVQWFMQGSGGLALLSIYNVVTQLADGLGGPVSQSGRVR